jgi:L-fucose isomerase-like protein
MREEKVDAIFLINGNFGNEEVAAMVAKALGVPVLLWGPQDDVFEPDGTRYSDSQCGLFGMSRQLQRFNIPFTYIENCRIEDAIFTNDFRRFVSVACMVKNFRGMRIAQVGMRPKSFCSVIFNEGELMQRFGLQIIPVNLAVVIDKYNRILRENDAELEKGAKLLSGRYVMDDLTPPLLKKVYAFVLLYKEIFAEYRVDAVSAECWTAMQLGVGAMPCTAYSVLADMGYVISCESDMYGAITMALLSCASLGKRIPFFGEFTVRHPEDRNVELLWHCGPFAYSLKKPESEAREVNMRQWFQVKDGKYTVARLDQCDGKYSLLGGLCESADGPYTFGTYLWARFDNLSAWEKKLIEGPYIHHMAEIEGDYTGELREFCKYVPSLSTDSVNA